MSQFKFGESSLHCNYLYSKALLDDARARELKLHRQVTDEYVDDALVQFVCERVIYGWSNVLDQDGNQIEFEALHLYQIFEKYPEMFIEVLKHCSKFDNFSLVA